MKHPGWLKSIWALSLAFLTIIQGCGANSSQVEPVTAPAGPGTPRPVTDLSELAPGSALSPFGKREQAIARNVTADTINENNVQDVGGSGVLRNAGDEKHPCEQRLLNKKAEQFQVLSARLFDQVFDEIAHLENGEDFSHLKLPTDLKWVIVTATLNNQGVLKELVIDQHSGEAAVDKLVIAACKKGLYIHSPPPEARDANGNYKIRLEARFENYATSDGEHWDFKTYLGLAIL